MVEKIEAEEMFPAISVWNVVFLRSPRENWWDWLTPEPWRHVCAFGYSVTTESWVIFDVADKHSRISVVDGHWFDRWVAVHRPRFTSILQIHTLPGGDIRARLGLWCVTAVKHLVGLPSGALRPRALHRDLMIYGATPAFEDLYGTESEARSGRPADKSASSSS